MAVASAYTVAASSASSFHSARRALSGGDVADLLPGAYTRPLLSST